MVRTVGETRTLPMRCRRGDDSTARNAVITITRTTMLTLKGDVSGLNGDNMTTEMAEVSTGGGVLDEIVLLAWQFVPTSQPPAHPNTAKSGRRNSAGTPVDMSSDSHRSHDRPSPPSMSLHGSVGSNSPIASPQHTPVVMPADEPLKTDAYSFASAGPTVDSTEMALDSRMSGHGGHRPLPSGLDALESDLNRLLQDDSMSNIAGSGEDNLSGGEDIDSDVGVTSPSTAARPFRNVRMKSLDKRSSSKSSRVMPIPQAVTTDEHAEYVPRNSTPLCRVITAAGRRTSQALHV